MFDHDKAISLFESGMSYRNIAKELKHTYQAIGLVCRKYKQKKALEKAYAEKYGENPLTKDNERPESSDGSMGEKSSREPTWTPIQ